MPSQSERMSILDRLEKGEITPDEAARLLSTKEADLGKGGGDSGETAMDILSRLERGEISTQEAAQLLERGNGDREARTQDFEKAGESTNLAPETERVEVREERFDPARTWGWWFTLIASGAVLTFLAGLWMSSDVRDGSFGIGFLCAWLPLAIGVLLMVLGVAARRGPWANLWINRRRRGGDTDVILDVPVPVGMAGVVLRTVGRHIPGLDEQDVDKLLNALQESRRKGEHIQIQSKQDNDDEDIVDITLG